MILFSKLNFYATRIRALKHRSEMAHFEHQGRVAWVKGAGTLIVVSDIHGNLGDFLRVIDIFEQEKDACLLFLGDLFHGPYLTKEQWTPYADMLGDYYYDQSAGVYRALKALTLKHPQRVMAILGNHEHAHVGGPKVAKFTPDEADSFENQLNFNEKIELYHWLQNWPWMVGSECGVAFTHGAPPPIFFDLEHLENESLVVYNAYEWAKGGKALLGELLWRRNSPIEHVSTFLKNLNGFAKSKHDVVVYGHEPSPGGYTIEHARLFNLSSSFAMRRAEKGYLRLNLSQSYGNSQYVSEGFMPLYD